MKKLWILIVILAAGFSYPGKLPAAKIGDLPEITTPKKMVINGNQLYICERTTVYIYSLPELKFLKKFGQLGEGPGEFKISHGETGIKMDIHNGKIIINSSAKVSYYNSTGGFIRDEKVPPFLYLLPIGANFVGHCLSQAEAQFPHLAICFFDNDYNKQKELFNTGIDFGMGAKIVIPGYNFKYLVHKKRIFISTGKNNIHIEVFDQLGNELYKIRKELESMPVTAKIKDKISLFYRTDPGLKNFWPYYKQHMIFSDLFPGVKNFFADGDRIYVQTHNQKANKYKWLVFTLNGKELTNLFLPVGKGSPVSSPPYTIAGGKYYYLMENQLDDGWELFVNEM